MITFEVRGQPAAQGSKRHVGGGRMIEMSKKIGPWREAVRAEAQRAISEPMTGPVHVVLAFSFPRPKGHYRTGRFADQLRPAAPMWHSSTPDLDKLIRAVLDGLTAGGAWKDDGQVCDVTATKVYGNVAGCGIELRELEEW